MPMRLIEIFRRTRSRERLLRVLEALLHFFRRCGLTPVFVLDVGGNRPLLLLEQLEYFADRRLALAPRDVVALVLLAILQVQVRDVGVVLADVGDRVVVGGGE